MTDMTPAARARENALSVEAKKHALRQQQDGCWIMTLRVHQNDMPEQIMKAPMGTRYMLALVEIGDDEQPLPHGTPFASAPVTATPRPAKAPQPMPVGDVKSRRPFGEMSPAQQAGMLSQDQGFWRFLEERHAATWNECNIIGVRFKSDIAAAVVRELCEVNSRAEITPDNVKWSSLVLAYRLWQREPEVVPA